MRRATLVTAVGQPCLMAFDRANPRAIEWARRRSAFLVREVRAETQAAIRRIIARAIEEGIPPARAAQLIRDVPIGLTRHQADAVANLSNKIAEATARAQRLGRATTVEYGQHLVRVPARVRVVDGQRVIVNHVTRTTRLRVPPGGLPPARVASLQLRYAERLRRLRALTIARTETITASNQGQIQLWKQARTSGLLRGTERKKWTTTPDDRRCPFCAALDGVTVGLDEQFDGGDFGSVDGPTLHPNCRCAVVLETEGELLRRAIREVRDAG